LSYRPARPHRLADSVYRNRFLASINVYKYGLRRELPEDLPQKLWTANGVWVRHCGNVQTLTQRYDGPPAAHPSPFEATSRHKPWALAAHRDCRQRRRPQHTGDRHSPPRPAAQDPVRPHSNNTIRCLTVFPGKPARFFERPEKTFQRSNAPADHFSMARSFFTTIHS
jgi:hypothetical protein